MAWKEEWNHNLIEAAREKVVRQVPHKQYQIYDLYVLKEMPVGEVSKTLGVITAQVYLAKHGVGKLMQKELKLLEQQTL